MQKNLKWTKSLFAVLMSVSSVPAFSADTSEAAASPSVALASTPVVSSVPEPTPAGTSQPVIDAKLDAPAHPAAKVAKTSEPQCSQWKPGIQVDPNYLAKLERNVAKEKVEAGILYSQDKLVLLLAKDHAAAKIALTHKDKMEQKDGKVDLRGVNLNGFNLSGLDLDNVDLKGAELNGANLSGTTLRGSNLYKAEFEEANLNFADLSFANVSKADFEKASLCGTSLESSDLEDAEVTWAYLKGARLDRATHVPDIIYKNSENILRIGLAVPPLK